MNIPKKKILMFCEFYLGFIGVGCLILLIYTLSFPMFIDSNPNGIITIYTNLHGELIFEYYFVIILLIFAIFSLGFFIYDKFTE